MKIRYVSWSVDMSGSRIEAEGTFEVDRFTPTKCLAVIDEEYDPDYWSALQGEWAIVCENNDGDFRAVFIKDQQTRPHTHHMNIRNYINSFPKRTLDAYLNDYGNSGWSNLLSCDTEEQVYNLLSPYMELEDMEQDN